MVGWNSLRGGRALDPALRLRSLVGRSLQRIIDPFTPLAPPTFLAKLGPKMPRHLSGILFKILSDSFRFSGAEEK